jgi:lycopene cyclase domain-containing protein
MSLYLWLNILSIAVPFLVSFHPKSKLYKDWNALFLATFLAMTPYLIWDVFFTKMGYWGFNENYLLKIYILGLPLEEILFFICIPYACIFTHYALLTLFPKLKYSETITNKIVYFLLFGFLTLFLLHFSKAYTMLNMLFAIIILTAVFIWNKKLLQAYFLTFIVMLIPFIIVNGILTGTGIPDEIVWYNNNENLSIRFLTIPIEDFVYAFSLILLNLALFEWLKEKFVKKALAAKYD